MKLPTRAALMTLAAGGLCSQAALAATINVPADFATIQGAINAATSGDDIVVAPGIYAENLDYLGKTLLITSTGGSAVTTIDGSGGASSTVTIIGSGINTLLEGFTIIAGPGQIDPLDVPALATSGGGLFVQDSTLDLTNCIVRDANTTGRGAGAHFIDSMVTVDGCTFTNNVADAANLNGARGGGVAISGINIIPNVTFTSTTFSNNSTGNNGGGLSIFSASADLDTCTFTSNNADNDGGGLQVLVGDVTLTGCSFDANTSVEGGGVHMNTDATGTFTNCDFDSNTSLTGDTRGGAFYALGTAFTDPLGEITIDNCNFTNNAAIGATGRGGGLYLTSGATTGPSVVTVLNSTFTSNSTTQRAGGAYVVGANANFDNCTFDQNTSDADGGAMYFSSGGSGTITNSMFTNNNAADDSGAIQGLRGIVTISDSTFDSGSHVGLFASTVGPSDFTLTNCTFTNGTTNDAGAVYSLRGILAMTDCTVSNNTAVRGAGLATFGTATGGTMATITNCTFDNNTSQEFSGGIGVSGAQTVVNADRVTITNNEATIIDAGGVVVNAGELNLSNSLVANNTGALIGGSAASVAFGAVVNFTNSTFYGNINPDAAAAIGAEDTVNIANSIIWNNDGVLGTDAAIANITHTIITGGAAGTNNLNTDPLLTDPGMGDYSLSASSPAIDAGDNVSAAAFALDLPGNTRAVDDPATADTGTGASPLVDMGAFEFQPTALPCPGDIADDFGSPGPDGMVSFGDFLALLGVVGPCPGGVPGCFGDIADDFGSPGPDGMVSFGDFLALLGLVGPCP